MKIEVIVNSSVGQGCALCSEWLDGSENFMKAVRHLQDVHGLTCLHVGQETTNSSDGSPWHSTVAVFGTK